MNSYHECNFTKAGRNKKGCMILNKIPVVINLPYISFYYKNANGATVIVGNRELNIDTPYDQLHDLIQKAKDV